MEIGEVLSRAWKIIWRHKVLWIFGILAGCGQAASSANQTGFRSIGDPGTFRVPPEIERFFERGEFLEPLFLTILGVISLFVILLWVVVLVLQTMGRIGLVHGTLLADRAVERISVGDLFNASLSFFWRVLLLNLLAWIVIFLATLFIGLPFGIITCGLGLLCMIPILWIVNIVVEQANIAVVVENRGILEGLRRGWDVVRTNLGVMIIMSLILNLAIALVGGFIIGLPVALTISPLLVAIVFGVIGDSPVVFSTAFWISILLFLLYLPILILLSGILRTYIGSAWALTFLRLTTRPSFTQTDPVVLEG
jgi:hypothetical protein